MRSILFPLVFVNCLTQVPKANYLWIDHVYWTHRAYTAPVYVLIWTCVCLFHTHVFAVAVEPAVSTAALSKLKKTTTCFSHNFSVKEKSVSGSFLTRTFWCCAPLINFFSLYSLDKSSALDSHPKEEKKQLNHWKTQSEENFQREHCVHSCVLWQTAQ